MNAIVEALPFLYTRKGSSIKRYIVDTFLALGGILLVTGAFFVLHLYPGIPDSWFLYLLVVLALASTRSLYAAILASFAAFFIFDFLFVAPVYSFIVTKFADVLALAVFLITALITGQFAVALRARGDQAGRRAYETQILYDLMHAINREEDLGQQLAIFTKALVEVFSPWGIHSCQLLLADEESTEEDRWYPVGEGQGAKYVSTSEEEVVITWIKSQGRAVDIYSCGSLHEADKTSKNKAYLLKKIKNKKNFLQYTTRFLPLKTEQKVIGIVKLEIEQDSLRFFVASHLSLGQEQGESEAIFFFTFLEQAVSIIERGRLLRESVQMKVLQQTDVLRAALLSSVSHDLRTPLATIKTAATSLMQNEIQWDEDARMSFATAIERESDRLNSLVENLLDMSRVEAGILRPEKVWYPLDELILDVLDRMRPHLRERVLQIELPADLPPVELDYVQVDQVLSNIIENALYYTPESSPIEVSVQVYDEWLEVRIADRGPGIKASEIGHIFDKFYRVLREPQTLGYPQGAGLGLAICKGLVEAHGGQIWVEERAGGGACFCFTLPMKQLEGIQL